MRRLYLRIYLAVLASLAVFALLSALAWNLWARNTDRPAMPTLLGEVAAELLPAQSDAAALQGIIDRLHQRTGAYLRLRDAQGAVIAESGPMPGEMPFQTLTLPDGRTLTASRMFRGPPGRRSPFPGFVTTLIGIALAVGIGAYPVVRRLTRRLEDLQGAVTAFGEGKLDARAPVRGHDEVATLANSFNQSAQRIETLVTAHKNLLANASHELRSPLARIRMGIGLLQRDAPAATREELTRSIAELDALVDEILLASRLDASSDAHRERRAQWEPIDLVALVAEACAQAQASFEVSTAPQTVVSTRMGDARLLRRLVRNLLENARRYGAGSSTEVTLQQLPGESILLVCDRGPGVPEAERERIFEPFYRARGASEKDGGVGLGLALVRQIAEHHGGKVRCLAREGGGSCFEVTLPRA